MPLRIPSTIALQCLEVSERLGSFTRAARALNLTQGAVSRQVIGLEHKLGLQLLERRRESLVATPAGRAYLLEVRQALSRLERATIDIALHQGRGGRLHLSAPSSFCNYWLAPRLSGFVHAHPHITLNLSTYLGPVDFSATSIDAAIMVVEGPVPGLHSLPVLQLALRPYACPALAARVTERGDLARQIQHASPLLTLIHTTSLPQAWETWTRQSGQLDAPLPDEMQAGPSYDLLSMSLNAAIAGIGLALLPSFMTEAAVGSGQLEPVSDFEIISDRSYYLCYPSHNATLPALAQFSHWLQQSI
ncbi:LysR family glycine cleavage system transcriptional activator [Ottowia thiooxydans]|uniref:LysR family glycine cleavage system transcriptional activator n=2 Tax=Ottowia thiooxydans TaxID=219182 RepID=A0ABV2Q3U1_9BURK